jgi:segregation and condensation protein B
VSDSKTEPPFRVRAPVHERQEQLNFTLPGDDPDVSLEDLEAAYLRALEASDVVLDSPPGVGDERFDSGDSSVDVPPAATGVSAKSASAVKPPSPVAGVTQQSVLEALLFVGGASLTTRKLAEVLNLRDADAVEPLVQQLNARYGQECRPYVVGFHQGGYLLELRSEFEPVRRKAYGLSPKEVRLSHEALEILALVAYRQPLSDQDLKLTDRKNAPALIRQLLRRELVALHRSDADAKRIAYITTPRFLQLFGIGSLDDLPYPEDLEFK